MQKIARKLVAATAATAMLASFVAPALAANISNLQVNGGVTLAATTTITTISFSVPANVGAVVVRYPASVDDTGFVLGDVSVANAATDIGATGIAVDTTADTISFSGDGTSTAGVATITLANGHLIGPASGNIAFAVAAGADQGAAIISVAGANTVVVSATVVPTLSMSIAANGVINLGVLSSSAVTDSAGSTDVTIGTNAAGGYTLSASAVSSDPTNMPLASRNSLAGAGTPGFGIYVSNVTGGTAAVAFDGTSAATAISGSAATIATHNAPAAADVVSVKYSGGISALTPAGSYTLTTTYTIAGSF